MVKNNSKMIRRKGGVHHFGSHEWSPTSRDCHGERAEGSRARGESEKETERRPRRESFASGRETSLETFHFDACAVRTFLLQEAKPESQSENILELYYLDVFFLQLHVLFSWEIIN